MTRAIFFALFSSVVLAIAFPLALLADKTEKEYKHARALLSQGDLQGARTEFEDILNKKPKDEAAKALLGVTLTKLSEQSEQKGDRTLAVAELREALQLDPDEAYWHSALAKLLSSQGAADEAREEWSRAAKLSPEDSFLAKVGGSGVSQEINKVSSANPKVSSANPKVSAPELGGGYPVGGDITAPVPIERPAPPYTEKARDALYSGRILMEIVINAEGDVEQAWVLKPLGLGLDQNALHTVRTWKFKPATRKGAPVPVHILVEIGLLL
jgi:TonB family protein